MTQLILIAVLIFVGLMIFFVIKDIAELLRMILAKKEGGQEEKDVTVVPSSKAKIYNPNKDPMREFKGGLDDWYGGNE